MSATIWVDADACPGIIKEVIIKATQRTGVPVVFVANSYIRLPELKSIRFVQTSKELDSADDYIASEAQAKDFAVTQDIPLADELITKSVFVVTPRGKPLSKENIKSRLNIRDFMETMRASGVHTGGPSQIGPKDKQEFANQLDRWLTKHYINTQK